MRLTQGAFSFLPDLTDAQIRSQIEYCLNNGWAVSIEYTDDPHPRNTYWEMFGMPMFDLQDAAGVRIEIEDALSAPAAGNATAVLSGGRAARWRWALLAGVALLGGASIAGLAVWNLKPSSLSSSQSVARLTVAVPETASSAS